jgi:hypothetical protein
MANKTKIEISLIEINEIIQTLENNADLIDSEFGYDRSIDMLVNSGEMPDIYYRLIELRKEFLKNQE